MMEKTALTEFRPFSKLPIEMRSIIWKHSLPTSRTVLIRLKKEAKKDNEHAESFELASPCTLPIALRVCKESRLEALRHYHLAFSNPYHEARIYIDFSCDIVYMTFRDNPIGNEVNISPRKLRMLLDVAEANKIERMAVSSMYSETPQELVYFQSFQGLKELSVEFEGRDLSEEEGDVVGGRQVTLIEEEEYRMMNGRPPIDDMGILDRAFVLEMFHETRKAFPMWKAPNLMFVSAGAEVDG